jgi:hypothetical protein
MPAGLNVMPFFRFSRASLALALIMVLGVYPAVAAHAAYSSSHAPQKFFLRFAVPSQKTEATALLDEFLTTSFANLRDTGGIPGSDALQSIYFENDNESQAVKQWPGMELRYSGGVLYMKDGTGERRLAEVKSLKYMGSDWPLAIVDVGDIDFDGRPDFFILTLPAATGSFGYQLLDWDRKNLQGQPLFAPFPESKLPPSPDDYKEWLYFDKGSVPQPNFRPEKKMLEFIMRHGPYYDTERWCFSGSQYRLCEKLRQSYYAYAVNMYQIVRQMRFDRRGKVRSITCRPIGDDEEKAELLFAAGEPVPLYSKPGDLRSRAGSLEPGAIARVLEYKLSTFGPEIPAIWYKLWPLRGRGKTAWCCVTLDTPDFQDGTLRIAGSPKGVYKALGARRGPNGVEILLDNGSAPVILTGLPLVMMPFDPQR